MHVVKLRGTVACGEGRGRGREAGKVKKKESFKLAQMDQTQDFTPKLTVMIQMMPSK